MIPKRFSVVEVLDTFHFAQQTPDDLDRYRSMVTRSHLVERMRAVRDAIHREVGGRLIYEEVYMPPDEFLCRYVFEKDKVEFHMSLAILSAGPTVRFSYFKAKGWIHRLHHRLGDDAHRKIMKIKHKLLIDPEAVTDADVEQWFTYLLSGFRRSFRPGRQSPHPQYRRNDLHKNQ